MLMNCKFSKLVGQATNKNGGLQFVGLHINSDPLYL